MQDKLRREQAPALLGKLSQQKISCFIIDDLPYYIYNIFKNKEVLIWLLNI